MINKPIEFWIALVAGILFVIDRHKEKPFLSRVLISAMSGGLGFALHAEVVAMTGWGEAIVVMTLTALGYIVLDITASILADREIITDAIKAAIKKFTGGTK